MVISLYILRRSINHNHRALRLMHPLGTVQMCSGPTVNRLAQPRIVE